MCYFSYLLLKQIDNVFKYYVSKRVLFLTDEVPESIDLNLVSKHMVCK